MKLIITFFSIILAGYVCGQDVLSFDSLQPGQVILTKDAIYINADKVVKANYNGNIIFSMDTVSHFNSRIVVAGNDMYGFWGPYIYKADSIGNIQWSLSIDSPLCMSTPSANRIGNVIAGSDGLVLLTYQFGGSYVYNSRIYLDTSGQIKNFTCPITGWTDGGGIPTVDGGRWVFGSDHGTSHTGGIIREDSLGNFLRAQSFQANEFNLPAEMFIRSDSSHVVIVNCWNVTIESYTPFVFMGPESVTSHSFKIYRMPNSASDYFNIISSTMDPGDNIYCMAETVSGFMIFKIDALGNIVNGKCWSYQYMQTNNMEFSNPPQHHQSKILFKNDSLFASCVINGKNSIIKLDTSLSGNCYSPDQQLQPVVVNAGMGTGSSTTPSTIPVLTHNTVSLPLNQPSHSIPSGNFICSTTRIADINNPDTQIFPNPATNELIFTGVSSNLSLFNLNGEKLTLPVSNSNNQIRIDISTLPSGMYFGNFMDGNQHSFKFIKLKELN